MTAYTEKELAAFQAEAKAMFDGLMEYAAMNYHGIKTMNDICDKENAAIREAVKLVFADVSQSAGKEA